jgi:hypothetical protein
MRRYTKKVSHGRGTCPSCERRVELLPNGNVGSHTRRNGTRNVYCAGLGRKPKA